MSRTVALRMEEDQISRVKKRNKNFSASVLEILTEFESVEDAGEIEIKSIFTDEDLERISIPAHQLRFAKEAFLTGDEDTDKKINTLRPLQAWALYNVLRKLK